MTEGLDAVRGKAEWWNNAHEVKGCEVEGPFVNGDQFTAVFHLDVIQKADGKAIQMNEVALYTVANGKIVRELFFFLGRAFSEIGIQSDVLTWKRGRGRAIFRPGVFTLKAVWGAAL